MKQTYETGVTGENQAKEYLEKHFRMICLEQRYKTKLGEIDLIMQDRDMIVFVEVKTRLTGTMGAGLAAVDRRKQQRMAKCAQFYLLSHHDLNRQVRFDVLELTREGILYIPNAFQAYALFHR